MGVKDVVALLELLPKTVLAVAVLLAVIVFHKPISERLVPSLRSVELFGVKLELVKDELREIEKKRSQARETEIAKWGLSDTAFKALQERATRLQDVLSTTRVLWVDDKHPLQNIHERRALWNLGVSVDPVQTTAQAEKLLDVATYEVVITNYARPDDDGGAKLIEILSRRAMHRQIIFYTGRERPAPAGAHGLTVYPDELLHLIMDLAERRRSVGPG